MGNIVCEGDCHQKQDRQDRTENQEAGNVSAPSPLFVDLPVVIGRVTILAGKAPFQGRQGVHWIIPTLILRRQLSPDQVIRIPQQQWLCLDVTIPGRSDAGSQQT
jgi:hypothetical protein